MRKIGRKVVLSPEEVLSSRSIHTQKADLNKKRSFKRRASGVVSISEHGFATDRQRKSYAVLGSLFWITIMLIGRLKLYQLLLTFLLSEFHLAGEI